MKHSHRLLLIVTMLLTSACFGDAGATLSDAGTVPDGAKVPADASVPPDASTAVVDRWFSANSPINTAFQGTVGAAAGLTGYMSFNYDGWGYPTYVENAADPLVTISQDGSGGSYTFHLPPGYQAQNPVGNYSDAEMIIIGLDGNVYSFIGLGGETPPIPANATHAAWIFRCSFTTDTGMDFVNGVVPGVRATGWSLLVGLVDHQFLSAPTPPHGLVIGLYQDQVAPGTVPPALANDGQTAGASFHEGELLVIPASTPKPGSLSAEGSRIWDAAVEYGFYIGDKGGSNNLTGDLNSVSPAEASRIQQDISTIFGALHHATH